MSMARNSPPRDCGRQPRTVETLLRQLQLQLRPAALRLPREAIGIGSESGAARFAREEIKTLCVNGEDLRQAGDGFAARNVDRIVAAEAGRVNVRMTHKGGTVAFVAKAPDCAVVHGLEPVVATQR